MLNLRKIKPNQDCLHLYELLQLQDTQVLFPRQPHFLNPEDFLNWTTSQLSGYFHDFFVIEDPSNAVHHHIEGFLLAYDYRSYDSHCQICGYSKQGISSTLLEQFVDYLFREYPLNKIFIEAINSDDSLICAAVDLGFNREAILHEYKFSHGTYHDLIIMGLNSQQRRKCLCSQTV